MVVVVVVGTSVAVVVDDVGACGSCLCSCHRLYRLLVVVVVVVVLLVCRVVVVVVFACGGGRVGVSCGDRRGGSVVGGRDGCSSGVDGVFCVVSVVC